MHSRKNPPSNPPEKMRRELPTGAVVDVDDDDDDGGDAEAQRLPPMRVVESPRPSSSSSSSSSSPNNPTRGKRIGTALFYAVSSIWVIFANKIVLSTYKFPSVLTIALLQFASTTVALKVASALGYVSLLPITPRGVRSILPLSSCYLLNILTGLSATQNLSLPMMVLLRRASILMTMVSFSHSVNILRSDDEKRIFVRLAPPKIYSFSRHSSLMYPESSCWRSGC